MKIVMCSNYMNHHQLPFCRALLATEGVEFLFVATDPVSEMRKKLGYKDLDREFDWIIRAYESETEYARAEKLTTEADIVIIGNAPRALIGRRLKAKKLVFEYSERLMKTKWKFTKFLPRRLLFPLRYNKKNLFLLCASAYAAADFAKLGAFKGRTYQWGYFPEVKKYGEVEELLGKKEPKSLLWAGRIIGWKHPEYAVEVAKRLRADGYDFTLRMIGVGEKEEEIRALIAEYGLSECVQMVGSVSPEEVRTEMEKSEIFLFTSDKEEGWGAVLSEGMNSACAVVASHAIGAAPYLVQDGENGFLFESENVDDLYAKVKRLFDEEGLTARFGKNAYETMIGEWNPENAAKRFIELAESKLYHRDFTVKTGVCAPAEILSDDWYGRA
ncbi:MAG: glycosyltransferase [Clostridia bacterium]|nr:glycosyltransferase [Clostridia bacterium]